MNEFMTKILLVEDDKAVAKIIMFFLKDDYEVIWADTGGKAQSYARDHFDIILMDVLLPDINGIELCTYLRNWHNCPLIFLSCLDNPETIVDALEHGGDDYITKPFDNNVLRAYIQANLRRAMIDLEDAPKNAMKCSGFTLNAVKHTIKKTNEIREIQLSPIEFKILCHLMKNPRQYFTPKSLYEAVWGENSFGDVRTVSVHVHSLRKKIEEDITSPRFLKNAWGKGYYFDPNKAKTQSE
jgi:Response regulators consisting of a CheY-like receiver domain and a winged-helix DNA-binding domain